MVTKYHFLSKIPLEYLLLQQAIRKNEDSVDLPSHNFGGYLNPISISEEYYNSEPVEALKIFWGSSNTIFFIEIGLLILPKFG